MKTVSKINPEQEYENAKNIIATYTNKIESNDIKSLGDSIDNLITAARVLMDREERRRGHKQSPPTNISPKGREKGQERAESKKLPSERFPDLEVKEEIIRPDDVPVCTCCSTQMKESGLFDTAEKLEVIPKHYYIERSKRVKYTCPHCHGSMINTPAQANIVATSNYGDSIIIDVALSKYCDLIPIERYVDIASRGGVEGLPPQSLIGLTHHLANFLIPIYEKIKKETLASEVLLADETPHKMLEGDPSMKWYLWGFLSQSTCIFEAHNTRSGDVAFNFLEKSQTKYLLSDGYSGYGKAIKDIKAKFARDIVHVNCNAHAFRYFKEASITWEEECTPFLKLYDEIYKLEKERKDRDKKWSNIQELEFRQKMLPFFEEMKKLCEIQQKDVMPGSGLDTALKYFLNHYQGLTLCTNNIEIPLDNNSSERELRAPVIGRKTWYGTHSKRGAVTNSILFSIVQTCKMNKVNPRNYFPWVVEHIHKKQDPLSPYEYLQLTSVEAETQ